MICSNIFRMLLFYRKGCGVGILVGEILKKKREDLGIELREIANTLRIRYDYLKSIEDENFNLFPAEVYLKGYILEYAKFLNIDAKIILEAYEKDQAKQEKREYNEIEFLHDKNKKANIKKLIIPSGLAILLISLIIIFLAPNKKIVDNTVKNITKNNMPQFDLVPSLNNGKMKNYTNEAKKSKESSQQVLEIIAIDTTWILANIGETDSREVLMKPGESIKWYAKNSFSLKIGNAGGVRLIFNGKEIEKLGEIGQVISINIPDENKNI